MLKAEAGANADALAKAKAAEAQAAEMERLYGKAGRVYKQQMAGLRKALELVQDAHHELAAIDARPEDAEPARMLAADVVSALYRAAQLFEVRFSEAIASVHEAHDWQARLKVTDERIDALVVRPGEPHARPGDPFANSGEPYAGIDDTAFNEDFDPETGEVLE